ncbi:MAG: acyltransferase [Chlorobiales bacterium]|nr:acyltransferase [Chlorobiales bacterium]
MQEIRAHTGLRGFAAIIVMLGHIGLEYFFPWFKVVHKFLFGPMAVDLFFMLSSFILCYVYKDVPGKIKGSWADYHIARFARIYPLHIATMIVLGIAAFFMLKQGKITGEYKLIDIPKQLFLVNAYPYIGMERTWNPPAWSISIEYFAYIFLFPILIKAVRPPSKFLWLFLLCYALISINVTLLVYSELRETDNNGWAAILRGTTSFISGYLIYEVFKSHPRVTQLVQKNSTATFLFFLAILVLAAQGMLSYWFLLISFPPLILSFTAEDSFASKASATPIPVFFGDISYSVYMIHFVIAKMLSATIYRNHGLFDPGVRELVGIAVLFAIIFISWVSWKFFEMPARRAIRKRLQPLLNV